MAMALSAVLLALACMLPSRSTAVGKGRSASDLNLPSTGLTSGYRPQSEASYSVEVTVLDLVSRTGVPEARIVAGATDSACVTDFSGSCNIALPSDGYVVVTVAAEGYSPQHLGLKTDHAETVKPLVFAMEPEIRTPGHARPPALAATSAQAAPRGEWVPVSSPSLSAATITGQTVSTPDGGKIRITLSLPGLLRRDFDTEGTRNTLLSIPNGVYSYEQGQPVIPALTSKFVLPPGATVVESRVVTDELMQLPDVAPVLHVPVRVTVHGPVREQNVVPKFMATYPAQVHRVRQLGTLRDGTNLGSVTFWPVQYDPVSGSALLHTSLVLDIEYSVQPVPQQHEPASLLSDLPSRLAEVEVLPRGHRGADAGLLEGTGSHCQSTTPRAFLVEEDRRSEYSMISAGFWRDQPSGQSRNFFGVMTYSDSADSEFETAKQAQSLSSYGEVELVTSYSRVLQLIGNEWNASPGLVLFGKPEHTGGLLTPLASYLNWPLVGVFTDADLPAIEELASQLDISTVIVAGEIPQSASAWLQSGDLRVITLDGEREINQFFHLQKLKSGFYATVENPISSLYEHEIINSDALASDPTTIALAEDLPQSTFYLVVVDQTGEGEFDVGAYQLAAYRSAEIVNVGGYTANQIRSEINLYDPTYVAIFGDGDVGQGSCFFVTDPTGDTEDPSEIGTDFYYEVRESLTVGQLTDGWLIDSYVGRPIGSTDDKVQAYVNTLKRYEAGCLDADYLDWTISGSSTWDGGYEQSAVDVSSYLTNVAPAATLLLESNSPLYSQADDDFSKANYVEGVWGLDAGVTVGFAKGHGNDVAVMLGSGDPNVLSRDQLAAHEPTWRSYPFLQYTDSCMTARFMGADGTSDFDDDVNLGCGFIDAGAIAYIGTTMHATAGYIDGINQEFFQHRVTDWDYTLGKALAYARESWYDAQYYHSDWDKKTVLEMMLIGDPMIDLQLGSSEHPPQPARGRDAERAFADG